MKLIDWLQIIFIIIPLVVGFSFKWSWVRILLFAFALEVVFGILVYVFLLDGIAWLSILDLLYDNKELWLLDFVKKIGSWFGYKVHWRIDYSFYFMCALSGTVSHFLAMLPGWLFHYFYSKIKKNNQSPLNSDT
ncbi:MAG: hypothetical protein LC115_09565 [Bacteroidia bacterium]|nr:hypothetical protein [Bacteroidia bacterium]